MADAKANIHHIELEAVVIRADGTREQLGTVAKWDRSPLKRIIYRLQRHGRIAHTQE